MFKIRLSSREKDLVVRRLDCACVLILGFTIVLLLFQTASHDESVIRADRERGDYDQRSPTLCPDLSVQQQPDSSMDVDWFDDFDLDKRAVALMDKIRKQLGQKEFGSLNRSLGADSAPQDGSRWIEGAGSASGKMCPEFPLNMKGKLTCSYDPVTPDTLRSEWSNLQSGRLRPVGCTARERLAVIIPFMNRTSHLHRLLHNLLPVLERQQVDATFFVVEQVSPSMFNRATLHNIGFIESQKLATFHCYIFHDVDLVPLDDRILYRCGDHPRHFPVSIKRYGTRRASKMYSDYFGGIVGLTKNQYLDVNGNSNLYFGWGGEDDDLLMRVLNKGYQRSRENPTIYQYEMLQHIRNDRSRGNVDRMLLLQTAIERQDYEGLSTTKYKIKDINFDQLYVWIKVSLNMTELLLTAPDYTLALIRSLVEISRTVT